MESFGNKVDDRSVRIDANAQRITTNDGYVFPLSMTDGLPYLKVRPFTDEEWETLRHVVLTSDNKLDPSILDADVNIDSIPDQSTKYDFTSANTIEAYKSLINNKVTILPKSHPVQSKFYLLNQHMIRDELMPEYAAYPHVTNPATMDFESQRKYFLHAPPSVVKKTCKATTQFARSVWITGTIKDTYRLPFPALNYCFQNEGVATNTIYLDTPEVDDGSMCAQLYVGIITKFCDAYSMSTDGQFVNTLIDVIRKQGAMDTLISNRAQAVVSKKGQRCSTQSLH